MAWFAWFKPRRLDDEDFREEIQSHLAMATDERVAAGTDQQTAKMASLKEFGNVTKTVEAARSVWTPWWAQALHDWLNDVRYAIRVLAKSPSFSITVIGVLAVGIGLNAAVFTLLKNLALSPLSGVDESARLGVVLNETSAGRRLALSYPDYQDIRLTDRAFTGLTASAFTSVHLGLGSRAQRIMGELVSGNYFQELGVRAQIGRTLLPSDEVALGKHPYVVLSDGLWRRTFAADPDIVGKTVHLNAFPMTVVGVAEAAFHGTVVSFDIEVFVPIMMVQEIGLTSPVHTNGLLSNRDATFLMVLGRPRPGTSLAAAASQVAVLSEQLKRDRPLSAQDRAVRVVPIWESPYGAQTYMLPAVMVMSAMGVLLLLIVCANIAGLVLVRGISRQGEIAVRLAVGASRTRVVRLLLVENLVLAIPGAILGIALVWVGLPYLFSSGVTVAAPGRLFFDLSIDRLVIGFSALAACASALVFGFVPAIRGSHIDLVTVMNDDSSPRTAARGTFRAGLVVSQVAVSILLLIGAGLVTRSLDAARTADAGFDATDVISVLVDVKPSGYDEVRGRAFFKELLEAVRTSQGVDSATLAANAPLTFVDAGRQPVSIDGYEPRPDEDLVFVSNTVAPDYFRTLKIGLVAGREFENRDDESTAQVVVVNETMARRFFGDPAAAIGKRIRVATGEWRTVIGVARDVKYARINEDPRPHLYLPFLQSYRSNMLLHARGPIGVNGLLEQARDHIRRLDPDLPITYARSLREHTAMSFTVFELAATMLFVFGVAGMALAALGLYGLVSYSVKQSTHEIGIRMAVGARGSAIVRGFLGRGLRLGAIGAAIGIVTALAVMRWLGSVLYGVSATDPTSFGQALGVVLVAVIIATVIPAWRAARTDPLAALRRS
jgi:macrolide transport system ATP-binding/permease protein